MKLPVDYVGVMMFGDRYKRKLAKAAGVSHGPVAKRPPLAIWMMDQYLVQSVDPFALEPRSLARIPEAAAAGKNAFEAA